MNTRDILERRLQTLVWKKGLGLTIKQARQFITHGHIKIGDKRVNAPGMLIDVQNEKNINWSKKPIETIKPGTVTNADELKKAEEKKIETESAQKIETDEEKTKPSEEVNENE